MDGLLIGNFVIGGLFTPSNNKDLLSIKDGTTTTLTQQIQADKSAASSISTMKIALVDKDDFVSTELASGNHIQDILSREAQVYIGFSGGSHPEDSIRIFSGNITDFDTSAGLVTLTVSHPDNLKRQSLLPQVQTELTSGIDASVTSIPVASTTNYVISQDALTSYIHIDDEIIEVGTVATTSYDGCIRGSLGTIAATHDIDTEVVSYYRLTGQPIDLLLKLYTSGTKLFNKTENIIRIEGSRVFFNSYDVQNVHGLQVGDLATIAGLVANERILNFGVGNGESYIDVDNLGLHEPVPVGRWADFTSKYATLNFGAGLSTSQVDVEQHEKINDLFGGSFPELDIYIRETLNLKDFIENDVLYPVGAISVNRKGRISLSYTAPPLATIETKLIDANNITNPNKIRIKRNSNRRFYNTVEYKFDDSVLEEKLLRNNILFDADSFNRIKVGGKALRIEAKGFRKTASNFIDTQSRRFLDRYRLGAESYTVSVTYALGFNMEVGDIAIFDGTGLNIYDSKTQSRKVFKPRLVEVTNKSMSVINGKVSLELTDTAFSLDGRYATISPSSLIDSATTTEITIKTSFTSEEGLEFEKWQDYIGSSVRVHNSDFTLDDVVELVGFDGGNRNRMIVSPALSFTPTADMIVTTPDYLDQSDTQKLLHASLMPQVSVVSGSSGTSFDVSALDVTKFFIGSIIDIHKEDYSVRAEENEVISITGNTITLRDNLGFTPDSTYVVDLVGTVSDEGLPYRLI